MKINVKQNKTLIIFFVLGLLVTGFLGYLTLEYFKLKSVTDSVLEKQVYLENNLDERLFDEHLKIMENFGLSNTVIDLESKISEYEDQAKTNPYSKIGEIYNSYGVYLTNTTAFGRLLPGPTMYEPL